MENIKNKSKVLTTEQGEDLLTTLKLRFTANMNRHEDLDWSVVQAKLKANPEKLWSLNEMERTGGEPDVVRFEETTGEFVFVDCAEQSPTGRRSLCYDHEAWESRKANKPEGSTLEMAEAMGITMLNEKDYRELQKLGSFDTTTSSWLVTPGKIRDLGDAIFGDRHYDAVFIYHNSAESYYAARGFRGLLRV
jgi:hypothetical protein